MKRLTMHTTASLSVIVTMVCAFRFLLDGVSMTFFGHTLSIGHTDPLAYTTLLAPVLGAHGYIRTRVKEKTEQVNE
jgi:hypothetical protein